MKELLWLSKIRSPASYKLTQPGLNTYYYVRRKFPRGWNEHDKRLIVPDDKAT
jgi:hypothetical protein